MIYPLRIKYLQKTRQDHVTRGRPATLSRMHGSHVVFVCLVLYGCGGRTPDPHTTTPATTSHPTPPPKPSAHPPLPAEPIAARIGNASISVAEVDRAIERDEGARASLEPATDPAIRENLRARLRMRFVDELITRHLLLDAAHRSDISVTGKEVDEMWQSVLTANRLTEEQLVAIARASGFTRDEYRAELRSEALITRYVNNEAPLPETREDARKRLAAKLRAAAKISIELAEPTPMPLLDVSAILSIADVERILGRKLPPFESGRFDFENDRSITQDAWHLRAVGLPESHDLALQIWRMPAATLELAWTPLLNLPNARNVKLLADATIESHNDDVLGLAFIDRSASMVVLVRCGGKLCRSADQVRAIAKFVHAHLDRVTPSSR